GGEDGPVAFGRSEAEAVPGGGAAVDREAERTGRGGVLRDDLFLGAAGVLHDADHAAVRRAGDGDAVARAFVLHEGEAGLLAGAGVDVHERLRTEGVVRDAPPEERGVAVAGRGVRAE